MLSSRRCWVTDDIIVIIIIIMWAGILGFQWRCVSWGLLAGHQTCSLSCATCFGRSQVVVATSIQIVSLYQRSRSRSPEVSAILEVEQVWFFGVGSGEVKISSSVGSVILWVIFEGSIGSRLSHGGSWWGKFGLVRALAEIWANGRLTSGQNQRKIAIIKPRWHFSTDVPRVVYLAKCSTYSNDIFQNGVIYV
jgi:hypothetical protein